MRIIGLPKGFYKSYEYAVEHQMFSEFREKYEAPIRRYEYLRKTYKRYRSKIWLKNLDFLEQHFTDIVVF